MLMLVAAGCGGAGAPRSVATSTSIPVPALAAAPGADPSTGPVGPLLAPGGRYLIDRYGRTVLLHGVNLVYKVPPYQVVVGGSGANALTAGEVQTMASLGFDVVRLGIIWKGLEPGTAPMNDPAICTPGSPRASGPDQFDQAAFDAYMGHLDDDIALLGRYGISSLVD
ncbi:MAG TPA: hypothetical protein VKR22_01165, partial [Acidimicrobiales bacterium]|nr:hypothetical protein [Acidimicrobiales bacterium]